MRVTDRMMFERATLTSGAAREKLQRATDVASTGLKVQHPWDNPSSAGLIATHRQGEARQAAILETTGRASDELAAVDSALDDVVNLLSRARELAVQLSNDTYSANDRAGAAAEVDGLFRSAVAALNAEVGGRYVLGGFQDRAPPFTAAGAYVGDTGVRRLEVAPGVLQDVSLRADNAIKGTAGGVDVLTALQTLSTALAANNTTNLRATLDTLATGIAQVANARSSGGVLSNILDSATAAAHARRDLEVKSISREADADAIEAFANLSLAERGLDAALSASAKSFRLSLLDKM